MARRKILTELYSYGIYSEWERTSADIPKLLQITNRIPVSEGVEFGIVVKIKGAKGKMINYTIDHPRFPDVNGNPTEPFHGDYYISSNDFSFFLGDTVWLPIEDKAGDWTITASIDGKVIATKTLTLFLV